MSSLTFGLQILDRRYPEGDPRRYRSTPFPPGTPLDEVLDAASRTRLPQRACLRVVQCTPDGEPLFVHTKRCRGLCPTEGGMRTCELITHWGRGDG